VIFTDEQREAFCRDMASALQELYTNTCEEVMVAYIYALGEYTESPFRRSTTPYPMVIDLIATTADMLYTVTEDFQHDRITTLPSREGLVEIARPIFDKIVEVLLPQAI